MRIDKTPLSAETKNKIIEMLNSAEDKGQALTEAMEMVIAESQQDLVNRIVAEARRAEQDAEFKKSLGLHTLSENEKKFFEMLKAGPKQTLTANQIDRVSHHQTDQFRACQRQALARGIQDRRSYLGRSDRCNLQLRRAVRDHRCNEHRGQ